jgi:hypothetical protein
MYNPPPPSQPDPINPYAHTEYGSNAQPSYPSPSSYPSDPYLQPPIPPTVLATNQPATQPAQPIPPIPPRPPVSVAVPIVPTQKKKKPIWLIAIIWIIAIPSLCGLAYGGYAIQYNLTNHYQTSETWHIDSPNHTYRTPAFSVGPNEWQVRWDCVPYTHILTIDLYQSDGVFVKNIANKPCNTPLSYDREEILGTYYLTVSFQGPVTISIARWVPNH